MVTMCLANFSCGVLGSYSLAFSHAFPYAAPKWERDHWETMRIQLLYLHIKTAELSLSPFSSCPHPANPATAWDCSVYNLRWNIWKASAACIFTWTFALRNKCYLKWIVPGVSLSTMHFPRRGSISGLELVPRSQTFWDKERGRVIKPNPPNPSWELVLCLHSYEPFKKWSLCIQRRNQTWPSSIKTNPLPLQGREVVL